MVLGTKWIHQKANGKRLKVIQLFAPLKNFYLAEIFKTQFRWQSEGKSLYF